MGTKVPIIIGAAALAGIWLLARGAAPQPGQEASLFGMVTDPTGPIDDVLVELWNYEETELIRRTSTWDGQYSISGILSGKYVIYFQKDGYKALRRVVAIHEGANERNFTMRPSS